MLSELKGEEGSGIAPVCGAEGLRFHEHCWMGKERGYVLHQGGSGQRRCSGQRSCAGRQRRSPGDLRHDFAKEHMLSIRQYHPA